jgi:uncharacterized protein YyaL (SSP411 family)
MVNHLINARSPYLRKAANQPVEWFEWGEEAFEKAKKEDKPILLSIGGVWCHWCHVMAKESFENEEIAEIINRNFVAIKVDRDERPDIDRRYQEFVMATTGNGGWPLTVFLTPDGKPFFGGTYFPPEDRYHLPGFKTVLTKLAEMWKRDRERLLNSAEELTEAVRRYAESSFKGEVDKKLLDKGIEAVLTQTDYVNGGFGSAPKFHHAKAVELLLTHQFFNGDEELLGAAEITLDAMAKGGIYDHLLGGFFRYSTDDKWLVPHYEKMLYDNAELLYLYSIAYALTGKRLYQKVAEGIVEYYRKFGCSGDGGFYASQDADIGELDEGGYYLFSDSELREILEEREFRIATLYFDIQGSRKLPRIFLTEEEISKILGIPLEDVERAVDSARRKMLEYREQRERPYIDTTIYAGWNGLMIEALCMYHKVFENNWGIEIAEKTANRLIKEFWDGERLLHTQGVEGFSEDYIFLARGLLALFEVTQRREYLEKCIEIVDTAVDKFWDSREGGFFDSEEAVLGIRLKNFYDTSTQSVNGSAPQLLLALSAITGERKYEELAVECLKTFAGMARRFPFSSASYMLSLYTLIRGVYLVKTKEHFERALKLFRPFKFVLKEDIDGIMVCEGSTCRFLASTEDIINQGRLEEP